MLKFSLILAIGLSAIMTVICYAGAGPMVSAFLEQKDAYAYGMRFARTLIISAPVLGVLFVMINTIQAIGAALPSLILSISRQGLIYIPVLFAFNELFNKPEMLVIAQPVTDYVASVLSIFLAKISFRKLLSTKKTDKN